MTALLLALGALLLLGAWFTFAPLRRPEASADAAEPQVDALREEYTELLGMLRDLDAAERAGQVDPAAAQVEREQLQARAARTLGALDAEGAKTRGAPAGRPVVPVTLGVVGIVALVVVGMFTFLPEWQLTGVRAGEARALRAAVQVAPLASTAQRTDATDDWRALARAAYDAGRLDLALRAYGVLLSRDTRDAEALRRVGILLLSRGEKEMEAAQLVFASAQLEPEVPEAQLYLGFVLARAGQDPQALEALERYRTLDPQGREADDLISALRARQGDGDPGMRVYAQSCASCHGPEGRGGVGPNLRASRLPREVNERVIRQGAAGMPGFDLPEAEMTALLDLLHRWQEN